MRHMRHHRENRRFRMGKLGTEIFDMWSSKHRFFIKSYLKIIKNYELWVMNYE
jgi:hypothetical protein